MLKGCAILHPAWLLQKTTLTDAKLRQTLEEVLHRLTSVEEEAIKRTKANEQGG
jgi:hypothetical protein